MAEATFFRGDGVDGSGGSRAVVQGDAARKARGPGSVVVTQSMQSDRRRCSRRREIVDAAVRVFGRAGLADASIHEGAADAGVAPTAVYYYFAGKEDLFDVARERVLESITALVRATRADDAPIAREAGAELSVRALVNVTPLIHPMRGPASPLHGQSRTALRQALRALAVRMILRSDADPLPLRTPRRLKKLGRSRTW